jgi:hypothetical protein
MTGKKSAGRDKKATTVVASDPDDLRGVLKQIGGSRSDDWNNILAHQTVQTLWLKHSDKKICDQQCTDHPRPQLSGGCVALRSG